MEWKLHQSSSRAAHCFGYFSGRRYVQECWKARQHGIHASLICPLLSIERMVSSSETFASFVTSFVPNLTNLLRRFSRLSVVKLRSVDAVITSILRTGKMLRSDDPNAEVGYLVEVAEDWQGNGHVKAFDTLKDCISSRRRDQVLPGIDWLQVTKQRCSKAYPLVSGEALPP